MPTYGRHPHGRLHGHGLNTLGLDPARLILVETAHRKATLWAIEEALRSAAPAAVAGFIDTLDLKLSQRLHLAAADAGLPLFLLRPAPTLEASAAATRWRIGTAEAARDRFGLVMRPRWHLHLERCRNGRPGQWVVEYDHVAHRFSLAAALADPAHARGAGEEPLPKEPIAPDEPFVLVVAASGGPRIAALNESGGRFRPYNRRAACRRARESRFSASARRRTRRRRRRSAKACALWATRYTPTASPWSEDNGADGFFLDIEGASHLFGGEEKLIADLAARLEKNFGLPARIAVADTAGAAWALSRFQRSPFICLAFR